MRSILAPLLIALLLCGCTRTPSATVAARAAAARSNAEAKRLYQIEPFKPDDGALKKDGTGQVWEALTSADGHDLTAKVTLDDRNIVVSVDVRMLIHPTKIHPTRMPVSDLLDPARPRAVKPKVY